MNRTARVIFLLLGLLALIIIGYDYEWGHMREDLLSPEWCPVCSLFQSTELGHLLLFFLLFIGILRLAGFISLTYSFSDTSIDLTDSSPRSPPFVK